MPNQFQQRRWFIPAEGISRTVIYADINRYLGPDATVIPGEQEGISGYIIQAARTLTTEMIQDLKLDSSRWKQECGVEEFRDPVLQTHRSRVYYEESASGGNGTVKDSKYPIATGGGKQYALSSTYSQSESAVPKEQDLSNPRDTGANLKPESGTDELSALELPTSAIANKLDEQNA
ncbi:hypothetical protein B0J11DRAFT_175090 [Dendryphion nanum]|uniref:Uncharacterized protein n=1 Tax=Dendryphion nanum TaxID=256645 RepID=A0A9P9IXK6_9PLEO|nr:hypothetical protein B0J11DRAFT_175090 [Dendryphion nanum]